MVKDVKKASDMSPKKTVSSKIIGREVTKPISSLQDKIVTIVGQFYGTPLMLVLGCLSFTFYVLLAGPTWWSKVLMALYMIYCFATRPELNCGYSWQHKYTHWFRSLSAWDHAARYFSTELVKTAELDEGPYVIGNHPHGVFCTGFTFAMMLNTCNWNKLFPKQKERRAYIISLIFRLPFLREILFGIGCTGAERPIIEKGLKRGETALFVVGGAQEAILFVDPVTKTVPLVLKKRFGFVKIAMEHKAPLVPSYSFGEHDIYKVTQLKEGSVPWKIQQYLKNLLTFSIPVAQGAIGLFPYQAKLKVVVGAPIPTDDYEGELTEERVARKLKEYQDALEKLFEEHKEGFYPKDYKLQFI